jgi:hypothetical protein
MNQFFLFCDDHFKIFVLIWIKLREYYFETKNKSISLKFIVKKTSSFLRNIRKQCTKIERFKKIAKFVHFLEIELVESERFIEKLQHLALIAEIFELPEPINNIIKQLGLDEFNDLENNDFSNKINSLFKNIDDSDLEKKIDIIEESINEEGTLVNFLKNKEKKIIEEPIKKIIPIIIPQIESKYNYKTMDIHAIPRFATPNPRTQYRHH